MGGSTAPPEGWISEVGSRRHSPMRRRPQPAYGWATACHVRAYRRPMVPSTGRPGPAQDAQTLVTSTRRPVAGPFTRWPRVADAVLALVVFLVILVVSPEGPDDELAVCGADELSIAALVVCAVASGVLSWRRSQPLVVFGVIVTLALAATVPSAGLGDAETVGIALMFALYSVGRRASNDRWGYIALGGALAFVTISSLGHEEMPAALGFGLCFTFVVWYSGRRLRIRGERAAQLEREQAAEARRAVAEERTRIARELHDVVAHRVSLMTVQAGAAKTVAADDPESASQAMRWVPNPVSPTFHGSSTSSERRGWTSRSRWTGRRLSSRLGWTCPRTASSRRR